MVLPKGDSVYFAAYYIKLSVAYFLKVEIKLDISVLIQFFAFLKGSISGMCPLRPLHQNLSDFLGEKEDLYLTFPSPIPHLFHGIVIQFADRLMAYKTVAFLAYSIFEVS
jgi:hypothetical protein